MTRPEIRREDESRFLKLMADFAAIGATPDGGVCRLAGSPADGRARRHLAAQLADLGAELSVDPVGNQFGRMAWGDGSGAILCGSHLDSQPTGGRFDGSLGVAAALAAAHILRRGAGRYRHDLVICNWTNEEGARFTPSLTGSSVFAGQMSPSAALLLRDGGGATLGEALAGIGFLGQDSPPRDAVAAIELHVEQGPALEAGGQAIGVVVGNWAARKMRLHFRGKPAHTGPTPAPLRRDALLAAARFVCLAHDLADRQPDGPVVSAARAEIYPNSANVIASDVRIWLEIRHPDHGICDAFGTALLARCAAPADLAGCRLVVEEDSLRRPTRLSPHDADIAREVCDDLHLPRADMQTVAGHDALALAAVMPSTLLFVPSAGGLSHSPREFTCERDMIAGLHVLVHWLHRRLTG